METNEQTNETPQEEQDETETHLGLYMAMKLLEELADDCKNGEWVFDADEAQASRVQVDAIAQSLATIETQLVADEAKAVLLSLTVDELASLLSAGEVELMRVRDRKPSPLPGADATAEAKAQQLENALHKVEFARRAAYQAK